MELKSYHQLASELVIHLESELLARRGRNPRYSLRAFARQLQLSPSTLSDILAGKHHPSPTTIEKICTTLDIEERVKARWLQKGRGDADRHQTFRFYVHAQQVDDLFRVLLGVARLAGTSEPPDSGNYVAIDCRRVED